MKCLSQDEAADYRDILDTWVNRNYHISFMPAVSGYVETAVLMSVLLDFYMKKGLIERVLVNENVDFKFQNADQYSKIP